MAKYYVSLGGKTFGVMKDIPWGEALSIDAKGIQDLRLKLTDVRSSGSRVALIYKMEGDGVWYPYTYTPVGRFEGDRRGNCYWQPAGKKVMYKVDSSNGRIYGAMKIKTSWNTHEYDLMSKNAKKA